MELVKSECSCEKCANMCRNSPCFPTPSDVISLFNTVTSGGLKMRDFLMYTVFVDVKNNKWYDLIAPRSTDNKDNIGSTCVFLHKGLCLLHKSGLKPTEGKVMHHDIEDSLAVRLEILKSWDTPEGHGIIKAFSPSGRHGTEEHMKTNHKNISYGYERG